jgi:MFS family permease
LPAIVPDREDVMGGLFANRWLVVIASMFGLLVGSGPVLIFSFNVFLKPVSAELGITRGDLSSAVFIATLFTAAGCPAIGWLLDRFGSRKVMMSGILLYALSVAGFGLMQTKPAYVIPLIFAVVGLIGAVQTPIPYAAVVAQWFDRRRGLALGIATAGVGLGVAFLPPALQLLIGSFGWRHAYFGLAIAVLILAWLPVALFVREPPALTRAAQRHTGVDLTAGLPGTPAKVAYSQWQFWALTIAFFLAVMAINGTLTHVVPLLTDRGVPPLQAAFMFSLAGYALILGRILAGWCLDRIWGPYVAICFFVTPMVGIALLGSGGGGLIAVVGAILCGVGIGAEIDLMAFFVSRYFGLKAYGKVYGVMFAVFNVGTGLGPLLSGRTFDMFHSYGPIFIVYEVALAITCLLFVRLGPYPYPAPKREDIPAVQQKAAA